MRLRCPKYRGMALLCCRIYYNENEDMGNNNMTTVYQMPLVSTQKHWCYNIGVDSRKLRASKGVIQPAAATWIRGDKPTTAISATHDDDDACM